MVITSYAASRRGLLLYLAVIGPVGGLVVGLIVLFAMGGTEGAVLFAVFLAIGAFYPYYFGFRQVCLVELIPTELRWRYALRSGAAPLSDVQSIRCSKVSRRGGTVDVATVEFTGRGRLKFLGRTPGLAEFLAKIHDTAPQVSVESPVR
jgi:hypothetical protein